MYEKVIRGRALDFFFPYFFRRQVRPFPANMLYLHSYLLFLITALGVTGHHVPVVARAPPLSISLLLNGN